MDERVAAASAGCSSTGMEAGVQAETISAKMRRAEAERVMMEEYAEAMPGFHSFMELFSDLTRAKIFRRSPGHIG
jgi:hypothetical protein